MKVVILGLIMLVSQIAAYGQSSGGVDEIFLARDDGNGKAGEAVSRFFTTDIPIYCVVQLASDASLSLIHISEPTRPY